MEHTLNVQNYPHVYLLKFFKLSPDLALNFRSKDIKTTWATAFGRKKEMKKNNQSSDFRNKKGKLSDFKLRPFNFPPGLFRPVLFEVQSRY